MKREKLTDVQAERDSIRAQLGASNITLAALARGDAPDAKDSATMPDGTIYTIRVFDVHRACGGVVLIGFANYGGRETFDARYFDDALIEARKTVTAMPDAYAYRDAFERLANVVRQLHEKAA